MLAVYSTCYIMKFFQLELNGVGIQQKSSICIPASFNSGKSKYRYLGVLWKISWCQISLDGMSWEFHSRFFFIFFLNYVVLDCNRLMFTLIIAITADGDKIFPLSIVLVVLQFVLLSRPFFIAAKFLFASFYLLSFVSKMSHLEYVLLLSEPVYNWIGEFNFFHSLSIFLILIFDWNKNLASAPSFKFYFSFSKISFFLSGSSYLMYIRKIFRILCKIFQVVFHRQNFLQLALATINLFECTSCKQRWRWWLFLYRIRIQVLLIGYCHILQYSQYSSVFILSICLVLFYSYPNDWIFQLWENMKNKIKFRIIILIDF